ncbi:ankyrin [Hypoxylon crocopeplum]|nr:ankyrin [Hypoxylon crocopeplum]
MDPLSATASIIALVQATVGIAKGVRFLRSLGQIPLEFSGLLNELSTLQAVAEQVQTALKDFEGQPQEKFGTSLLRLDPSALVSLKDDLAQIIEDLDALCDRLKVPAKPKKEGKHKEDHVSKWRWQKEKDNITKLRQRARNTREDLNLCFTTFISSQSYVGKNIIGDSELTELRHQHVKLTLDIREVLCGSAQRISQFREQHDSIQDENQKILREIQCSINQLSHSLLSREEAPNSTQAADAQKTESTLHAETMADKSDWTSMVYLEGSLIQVCPSLCNCNCHRIKRSQSPSWLNSMIGSLFLQYNTIPLLQRHSCDDLECKGNSTSSLRLFYAFPRWFLARSVELSVSLSSVFGAGSSLHLRVPRATDTYDFWRATKYNDWKWIRIRMAKKSILPTDIDENLGRTLVQIALEYSRFELAQFLAEQGFDTRSKDVFGRTPTSMALMILNTASLETLQSRELYSTIRFLRSLSMRQENHISFSKIHQAVLNAGADSLSTAISQSLSRLDGLDSYGYAPIHLAILRHDSAAVKMLLTAGASPDIPSLWKMTPLRMALLLDAGADVNLPCSTAGVPPLCYALSNPTMVRLLLDHGAHVNTPMLLDKVTLIYDNIPWNDANRAAWAESFDCLLSAGLEINDRGNPYPLIFSPVLTAVLNQNPIILEQLIEAGARLNVVDKYGHGILHHAALQATDVSIELLRRAKIRGIDPDMPDKLGWTPLDLLDYRISRSDDELGPGMRRMTNDEVQDFEQLIVEIRERNEEEWRVRSADMNLNEVDYETESDSDDPVDEEEPDSNDGTSNQDGAASDGSNSDSDDEFFDPEIE